MSLEEEEEEDLFKKKERRRLRRKVDTANQWLWRRVHSKQSSGGKFCDKSIQRRGRDAGRMRRKEWQEDLRGKGERESERAGER
jgi:hypothetical protein